MIFSLVFLLFHSAWHCPDNRRRLQSRTCATPRSSGPRGEPPAHSHVSWKLPVIRPQLFRALCHLFQPVFIDWVNNSLDYNSYSFPCGYIWQQAAHPSLTALLIRRSMLPFLSKATQVPATGNPSPPFSSGDMTVISCLVVLQDFCILLIKSVINTLRGLWVFVFCFFPVVEHNLSTIF